LAIQLTKEGGKEEQVVAQLPFLVLLSYVTMKEGKKFDESQKR
jgi:hypothetical protein